MIFSDDSKVGGILNNRSAFRICFVIASLFTMVTYLNWVSYCAIGLLFFWGCKLLIESFFIHKTYKSVPYYHYFLLFFLLSIPGMVMTLFKTPFDSLLSLILILISAMYVFVFLGMNTSGKENRKNIAVEIVECGKIIVYVTGIINIIGFVLLLIFHQQIWLMDERLIIFENRFIGIYQNPNQAGYICFVSTVFALLMRNKALCNAAGKPRMRKRIVIPCIVMNVAAIALSASNGALLISMVFLMFIFGFAVFSSIKRKNGRKAIIRASALIASIAVMFAVNYLCRIITTSIVSSKAIVEINDRVPEEMRTQLEIENQDKGLSFKHVNSEFGSGRISLYIKGLKLFCQHPITGIGPGGVLNSGIKENVGGMTDFHNAYITVAASGGIFSLAVFAFIGISLFIALAKATAENYDEKLFGAMPICVSFIGAYCVYALVEPTFWYSPSFQCVSFWMIGGIAVFLMQGCDGYKPYKAGKRMKKAVRFIKNG